MVYAWRKFPETPPQSGRRMTESPISGLPRHRVMIIAIAILVLAAALLVGVWDWNWLKPVIENRLSTGMGRQVTIGAVTVALSRRPLVTLGQVSIANPSAAPGSLAKFDAVAARIEPASLIRGPVRIPELTLTHPQGELQLGGGDSARWRFGGDGERRTMPEIGSLIVIDGEVRVTDPRRKLDMKLAVRTAPSKDGPDRLTIAGVGIVDGHAVAANFTGGALLSLGDEKKPYPVDLALTSGATRLRVVGTVERPMDFVGVALTLTAEGKDLADLYLVTGLPMPTSPSYRLTSKVDFANGKITLTDLKGVVGSSDLTGALVIDVARTQPLVTGALTSNKVALADLAGFIGATPGVANAPGDTAEQQQQRQADANKSTLIPDRQISLPRLRAADFHVTYAARRIESEVPLDNLHADLTIEAGRLALRPLSFGSGVGSITSTIMMDGQGDDVRVVADAKFENLDLSRVLTDLTDFHGEGLVGGRAALKATGNSLAEMLARGDGSLSMFMSGGDVSALLVNLAGLDLASSMFSILGLPSRAPLRCMIAEFGLAGGVLTARKLLFDTTQANILGAGSIDLRSEQVGMRITTEPKFPSIARLPLPIDVTGPLKSPNIAPGLNVQFDSNPLLGVLGLLSIQLGQGKDHDCAALLRDIKAAP